MDDAIAEKRLRELQLESYGRLMAGLSHDLKNHLGIIRESSGLISDMLEMKGDTLEENFASRLAGAAERIEKRVVLAAEMLHSLSSFAHRSDCAEASVRAGDILCEEAVFLRRFAMMKEVELKVEIGDEGSTVITSPALLHHLIYRLFLFALEQMEQISTGGTLILGSDTRDSEQEIYFMAKDMKLNIENISWQEYETALQHIGGRIYLERGRIILAVSG